MSGKVKTLDELLAEKRRSIESAHSVAEDSEDSGTKRRKLDEDDDAQNQLPARTIAEEHKSQTFTPSGSPTASPAKHPVPKSVTITEDSAKNSPSVIPTKAVTPPVETVKPSNSQTALQILTDSESEGDDEGSVYFPALSGCRSVDVYQKLNRIEEGTYGVVFRAKDVHTGVVYALKKLKMEKEKEGFPLTSIREIDTLLKVCHENVIHVHEIVIGKGMNDIFLVMEFIEHDLKNLLETMRVPFLEGEVKTLLIQLLRGIECLHNNWILHRDLKTSNLLLSHRGVLKIADFGLAREYGSPLKQYTNQVVTMWYRGPELFLGELIYSTNLDIWSIGCIFSEMFTRKPLFPGKTDFDMLKRIFGLLGTPDERVWNGYNQLPMVQKFKFNVMPNRLRSEYPTMTDVGRDLLAKLLCYDPKKRLSASEALAHPYFTSSPLPTPREAFPTYPARSELTQPVRRRTSPDAPRRPNMGDEEEEDEEEATGSADEYSVTTSAYSSVFGPAGFTLKFGKA